MWRQMDYDLMAADVRRFMDKQGYRPAVWLGHSMGGKVAMRAALVTPERVSGLVVADIAPVAVPPGLHRAGRNPVGARPRRPQRSR